VSNSFGTIVSGNTSSGTIENVYSLTSVNINTNPTSKKIWWKYTWK
jgi:hypothetical protein